MNEYFKDSKFFIKKAGEFLSSQMTNDSTIEGILYFSLGIERILKGLLYEINPIYILKNQEFKNSAPSLYKTKLLENIEKNSQISTNPDGDVLTFKLSLKRAKVFSESAHKNSSLLYTLSNYRDVIVHRPLSELKVEKLKKLLQKELFPVIKNFSKEIGMNEVDFFGEKTDQVKKIAFEIIEAEEFERKINVKIQHHMDIWSTNKENGEQVESAKKATASLLKQKSNDFMYEIVPCPVCENDALVRIEPDFDIADGRGYISGVFVDSLTCHFCELVLESYEELDYFDINGILEQEP